MPAVKRFSQMDVMIPPCLKVTLSREITEINCVARKSGGTCQCPFFDGTGANLGAPGSANVP